ncbi:MAG TPA: PEP-CTERM sorting domain-containing protein [Caldimonas sp.]|nr:PEP-CTERM sorting domain-containing protein [Caldimonas sp.]
MRARSIGSSCAVAAALLALGLGSAEAGAPPTLTVAGTNLGFTLNVIVSGLPTTNGNSYDVLGSAINSDGNIILNAAASNGGHNYVFHDVNNQTAADAISSVAYSGFASALAYSNGLVWSSAFGGHLVSLNNDGSVRTQYNNIPASQGMWTNPANGHLIAGSSMIDIDVSGATPTFISLPGGFASDGLTVSPDGHFAYGSQGAIYDLLTHTSAGSFGSVSGSDGMGVISSSNGLNGDIIVNTTNGNIVLVDVHNSNQQTIIASGGGYGDYVSPDRNDGSLLVSSSNNLLRLSCGEGCAIGQAPPPVGAIPEPETYALMLAGLGMLSWVARRRRA